MDEVEVEVVFFLEHIKSGIEIEEEGFLIVPKEISDNIEEIDVYAEEEGLYIEARDEIIEYRPQD